MNDNILSSPTQAKMSHESAHHAIKPYLPGIYANLLVNVVEGLGVAPDTLLADSGIAPEQLLTPIWRLRCDTFERLLRKAEVLTGETGLGFHLALQMTVSCHGIIGFAAMIAKDLRGALAVAEDFVALQAPALVLHLEVDGDTAALSFHERWSEYPVSEAGSIMLLLGFAFMGRAIAGRDLHGVGEFPFSQPAYFERFAHLIPGEVRFNQPCTRMIFPASYLDLPLLMADPVAAQLAREQCKRELAAMSGDASMACLVRHLVFDEVQGFCTIEDIARKLHLTPRTLQRQLAQEGYSFNDILSERRRQRALLLIRRHDLSLEFIAEQLGYTDVTNFSRAFRRWTGTSPGKYRS